MDSMPQKLQRNRRLTGEEFQEIFPDDAWNIVDSADRIILLSLNPNPIRDADGEVDEVLCSDAVFHGHNVIGQLEVHDAGNRSELIKTIHHDILDSPIRPARCFIPHHGVRAIKGQQILDLVICFSCSLFMAYPPGVVTRSTISRNSRHLLDSLLLNAGVAFSDDYYS